MAQRRSRARTDGSHPASGKHRSRAKAVLALACAAVAVFVVLGQDVEKHLKRSTLTIPGSPPVRAGELAAEEFRASAPAVAVLVRGPAHQLEPRARRLARSIDAHERLEVTGPWDLPDQGRSLRPRPGALTLVVAPEVTRNDFDWVVPYLRRQADAHLGGEIRAHLTGLMPIGGGLEEASLEAVAQAERLAMPVLIVILLLVFRSPIAAAIPLVVGVGAIGAAKGVVRLVADIAPLDVAAVTTVSTMALALGVDYGLLMVSRFREELARGEHPVDAARTARLTAGRTVVFASVTLGVAMVLASWLSPGEALQSLAVGTVTAVVVSAVLSLIALPAMLLLVGHNVDRWRLGAGSGKWAVRASRARLRPALAVPLILLFLLALGAPSLGLQTGPVDPRQLPPSNQARTDYEQFARVMGPGWGSPFQIVAVSTEGVITDPGRLRAIARWEKEVQGLGDVAQVFGPGTLAAEVRKVRRTPELLARLRRRLAQGAQDTRVLGAGLGDAASGVGVMRTGLLKAARGAKRLGAGARQGQQGARRLAAGLALAEAGTGRLAEGLSQLQGGAHRMRAGLGQTTAGGRRLRAGITSAKRGVRGEVQPGAERLAAELHRGARHMGELQTAAASAEHQLHQALRRLQRMTVGKVDPEYAAVMLAVGEASATISGRHPITGRRVKDGYDGLPAALEQAGASLDEGARGAGQLAAGLGALARGLGRIDSGTGQLISALQRLSAGSGQLASGAKRLGGGTSELLAGLRALAGGATRLAGGLGQVAGANDRLGAGLRNGATRAAPLQETLRSVAPSVRQRAGQFDRAAGALQRNGRRSPDMFESGYAVLAAIDGASERDRRRAERAVSLDRGGRAARLMVIPSTGPNDPRTHALLDKLEESANELGDEAGLQTGIFGAGADLATFDRAVSGRLPLLIAALSLVTWLVLVTFFRSVLLPLVAVAMNLLTVGAAFGVLALLVGLDSRPLGDAGFIDTVSVIGIFTITFGLSIDYQVFLMSRMKEGWVRLGDTEGAIQYGLQHTAGVIMGAALIMTAVFVASASSEVANLRQTGIGLAVAVMLDATVVRLVLLPAAMRALGRWNWWMPRWLDRLLPTIRWAH